MGKYFILNQTISNEDNYGKDQITSKVDYFQIDSSSLQDENITIFIGAIILLVLILIIFILCYQISSAHRHDFCSSCWPCCACRCDLIRGSTRGASFEPTTMYETGEFSTVAQRGARKNLPTHGSLTTLRQSLSELSRKKG